MLASPAAVAVAADAATAAAAALTTKKLVEALMRFARSRFDSATDYVYGELVHRYPRRPTDELREVVDEEARFEEAFQAKQKARLLADLPRILAEPDPAKRAALVQAILDREKRYVALREEAMLTRSLAHEEQRLLVEASPKGAYWRLSPFVKEHTLDCLLMGERFWPWKVLREFHPPRHYGCPCMLFGLDEAIDEGLMEPGQLPNPKDAERRFEGIKRQLKDLGEAIDEPLEVVENDDAPDVDEITEWAIAEAALLDHAKRELKLAGLMDKDSDYGGMLGKSVLDLVRAMEGQGHSGMSAQMALQLFDKLAKYEPLTPLTSHPDEWMDVSGYSLTPANIKAGHVVFQSRRNPSAFSEDGGKTYTLLDDRYPSGRKRRRTYQAQPHDTGHAPIAESLHTARDPRRYAKGLVKGGQFMPERGGFSASARRRVRRPRPLAQSSRSRWQFVDGVLTRIPEARHWEKTVAGVTYSSPPGSTNVYRGDQLVATRGSATHRDVRPQRNRPAIMYEPAPPSAMRAADEIRAQRLEGPAARALTAVERLDPRMPPVGPGDGPNFAAALDAVGFHTVDAGGSRIEYVHPSGARLVVSIAPDRSVADVLWQPTGPSGERRALQGRPPRDFDEFAADALAWADELGHRFDAEVLVPQVTVNPQLEDHAGVHHWGGSTELGVETDSDISRAGAARMAGRALSDDEARGVWSSYWSGAHEISHAVNPIHAEDYHGANRSLEEALAEEAAHMLAAERLAAQGQGDVLAWRARSPDAAAVQGAYRSERGALGVLLDQAKLTGSARRDAVVDLKFRVPPESRFEVLGQMLAAANPERDHPLSSLVTARDHAELTMGDVSTHDGSALPFAASPGTTDGWSGASWKSVFDAAWSKPENPWLGKGKGKGKGKGEGKGDAPPDKPRSKPLPPSKPEVIGGKPDTPVGDGIPNYDGVRLEVGKSAGGSNGARWAFDANGDRWLLKTYRGDRDRIATELLANQVYKAMGAKVADAGTIHTSRPEPNWKAIPDVDVGEPPMPDPKGKRVSTGMVVIEKGRVWVYEPKGHFGGYEHTFPKGGMGGGRTGQQNAHKELWEETGLHAQIVGVVGDFEGDTSVTRYYLAKRAGGDPDAHDGKETEAVKLLTRTEATKALNRQRDRDVLVTAMNMKVPKTKAVDPVPADTPEPLALTYKALEGEVKTLVFKKGKPSEAVGEHYMTDALLANWDFVGMQDDNIMWDPEGKPFRVDQGGTFEFRAQGQAKPFGPVPTEVWTMIRKGQGKRAAAVTEDQMRSQAKGIADTLTDAKVDDLVDEAPFADQAMRERIRENFKARVGWMRRFAAGEEDLPTTAKGAEARGLLADGLKNFKLNPDEGEALRGLATGDSTNAFLRSGKPAKEAPKPLEARVRALDGLLRDTKTPEDTIAFAKLSKTFTPEEADKLVGGSWTEKGYLRASTDAAAVEDGPTVLQVLMPAGTHAAYLPALIEHEGGTDDVLLRRQQRMKVVGWHEANGKTYVEVIAQ